jgi:hypothetical protein
MNLDFNKILKLTFSKKTVFKNQTLDKIYGYIAHITF